MDMKLETIDIQTFLELAGVKEETVKKNKNNIPGLTYESGVYCILKGTRYPYNIRSAKLRDSADRRYYLLDAVSKYKYIDCKKLRIYHEQFESLLIELLDAGLIQENRLGNNYRANAYDGTAKGDEVLKRQKTEAVQLITQMVSSAAGHFVGAVISEMA